MIETEKIIHDLSLQQSIELAQLGFIIIEDKRWYKISKHHYAADALAVLRGNEQIYKNRTVFFVLSQIQKNDN